jgi:histidinol-phosphate aminotransferase
VFNRIRQPFNLSTAQLAAAEAAVRDTAWAAACRDETLANRAALTRGLRDLGLAVDDSQANFVLPRFAGPDQAAACDAALRADGILVRRVAGYGLPEALRITVGTAEDCARVLASVARFLGAGA